MTGRASSEWKSMWNPRALYASDRGQDYKIYMDVSSDVHLRPSKATKEPEYSIELRNIYGISGGFDHAGHVYSRRIPEHPN